jgi:hypothetical protein
MEKVEIQVYSQAVNAWVIQTPGRRFPAHVIQGDSFNSLLSLAESVLQRARDCGCSDEELVGEAEELTDLLRSRQQHYEAILAEHRIAPP